MGSYFRARATLCIYSSLAGHKKIIDTGRLWPTGRVLPHHELIIHWVFTNKSIIIEGYNKCRSISFMLYAIVLSGVCRILIWYLFSSSSPLCIPKKQYWFQPVSELRHETLQHYEKCAKRRNQMKMCKNVK